MSKIIPFPITRIWITERAESFFGTPFEEDDYEGNPYGEDVYFYSDEELFHAIVFSFMELYRADGWTITQLISKIFYNRKMVITRIPTEGHLFHDSLKRRIIEYAISDSWDEYLREETRNPDVLRVYLQILTGHPDVGYDDLFEIIRTSYWKVDFLEHGIFDIVKSMAKYGLLAKIKGVDRWLRKTSARLQEQWRHESRVRPQRPPTPNPKYGGQKT